MRHYLNLKSLLIATTFFLMGIDNSSLLFGQTQSDPNNLKIIYTGSKVDILTYMVCIDSLKVGQKYSINVESNGCFHNSKLNLIISRGRWVFCKF
jgi:hypothetical protein